jgi:hypothetical protein
MPYQLVQRTQVCKNLNGQGYLLALKSTLENRASLPASIIEISTANTKKLIALNLVI